MRGVEKPVRIRQIYDLQQYRHVYARGDTSEDLEMLALASHRYYRWRDTTERETAG